MTDPKPSTLTLVETAWLIESRFSGPATHWWMGGGGCAPWTDDSLKAVRFARREDAEAARLSIDDGHMNFVSEHQWGFGAAHEAPPTPAHICGPEAGCDAECAWPEPAAPLPQPELLMCPWCKQALPDGTPYAGTDYDFCPTCGGSFSFSKPVPVRPVAPAPLPQERETSMHQRSDCPDLGGCEGCMPNIPAPSKPDSEVERLAEELREGHNWAFARKLGGYRLAVRKEALEEAADYIDWHLDNKETAADVRRLILKPAPSAARRAALRDSR